MTRHQHILAAPGFGSRTGRSEGTRFAQCLRSIMTVFVLAFCSPSAPAQSEDEPSLRRIPFITVRDRTEESDPAEYFGDERGTMRAGYCNVLRTELTSLQSIADNAPFYIPDNIVSLQSLEEHPVEQVLRRLQQRAGGRRPVLYTHGYYIDFERGCKRAALFRDSLGLADRFLLFSWPSDGEILNYTHDEADLYWSVAPLTHLLTDMIDRFGPGGFDIAAHSLGTRGVFLALVQLAGRVHPAVPLVNHLVLLAPDIDAGIFEQHLDTIRPLARHITVYVSANDKPLALSEQVHGYPRLGQAGPHLSGLEELEIVDISNVPVRYPSGHVYHLYHNLVLNDLSALLNKGKSAPERMGLQHAGGTRWLLQP